MLTMDDIIREGHPTLRARAEKIAFPLSDEDLKLAHDLMEFLENSQDEKIAKIQASRRSRTCGSAS